MDFRFLTFENRGHYGVLTLDNPSRMNCMSPAMVEEAHQFFSTPPAAGLRYVVVRGAGPCFSSGGDLRAMRAMDAIAAAKVSRAAHFALSLIRDYPLPVAAAVHGFAVGGGFELCLACDLVFAARDAWFQLPELNFDMLPGSGGTVRLPMAVGRGRAFWDILNRTRIDAPEALRLGLAQALLDPAEGDLAAQAAALLDPRVLPTAPRALASLKRIMNNVGADNSRAFDIESRDFAQLLAGCAGPKLDAFLSKQGK